MKTRIFSASLFCVALLGSSASAAVHPEVNQLLNEAVRLSKAIHPDKVAITEKLRAAEKAADQNRNELGRVVQVRNSIFGLASNFPPPDSAFDSTDRRESVGYDQPHQIPLPGGTDVVSSVSASN